MRTADQRRELGHHAAGVASGGRRPGSAAAGEFFIADVQGQAQGRRVDGDAVTFLHQGDGAAHHGFGGDVADDHAPGAAGEPAVGDKPNRLTQPRAHKCRRGREHLGHAGAALGPKVAQHHDVAGLDLAGQNGFERALLVVEHARGAGHAGFFQPGDLGHAAVFGQIALEDGQVAVGVHRLVDGANHVLLRAGLGGNVPEILGHSLAVDGDAVAMQYTGFKQNFHHLRNAASAVQIGGDISARGLHVAEHWGALANHLEVFDGKRHFGGMRNGQQMQHRVGRAARGHDHGSSVFQRLAGDDVARLQPGAHRGEQRLARIARGLHFFLMHIRHGGRVRQRHAHGLDGAGHGVGGVHAAAGAAGGHRALLDGVEIGIAHTPGGVFAHGLEDRDDVQILALVMARQNGAAIDENTRHIAAQHTDHGAGHVFVAAAHGDHAVHPLALHAGLDAVGNDFARHQRVLHALGAHGHAVGNGRRAEHLRIAASGAHALDGGVGQALQAGVARGDGGVRVGNADHRIAEVRLLVAHGIEHGAIGRTRCAHGDVFGTQFLGHGRQWERVDNNVIVVRQAAARTVMEAAQ
ncbi:hypothetical protein THICB1_30021 [Thiomonas arsenitoxydans]|uniref:Uncharacterized protein n=1 Tax=Thiomonas arsenitoxydans (strain DSM 22701 / CIP 110005 / 3As) TaxID=426114 RepID=A0ABM9T521_THIA3|nr:hypothetical protein THICB1_30021 [Thiomonas arsenitoxydans]CQR33811.1 hypothetical protein ACO7_360109 [Thiomonas arsenitoxydans]CQR34109.1 hypothetical protein ACO3_380109 [Thiomonas arsenitoxydans]CQR39532.1 hypothetical protein THICB6_80021 [Thiomonas arsenitoxydans]